MEILFLTIGIVIGILLSALLILIDIAFKRKVNSQGVVNHIIKKTNQKAEFIEPMNEQLEGWISNLEKDE